MKQVKFHEEGYLKRRFVINKNLKKTKNEKAKKKGGKKIWQTKKVWDLER